jgi:hypothetical protein
MSPFNVFVDEFNTTILRNIPGDSHCYISNDSVEGDESSAKDVFSGPELLNSLQEPGIPPHELVLKIGAVCRLTRNFDASKGLTKNTRVIVRKLLRHTVEIETISAVVAGKVVDPVRNPLIHVFCLRIEYRYRTDSTSYPPHQRSFSAPWLRVYCYSKADSPRPLLCDNFQWMPRFDGPKARPRPTERGVLPWTTLLRDDSRSNSPNVLILKYPNDTSTRTTNIVWNELLLYIVVILPMQRAQSFIQLFAKFRRPRTACNQSNWLNQVTDSAD